MSEIGVNPETGERYPGWADPETLQPSGYRVPAQPAMTTHDLLHPPPVRQHPAPYQTPVPGEGMADAMEAAVAAMKRAMPPSMNEDPWTGKQLPDPGDAMKSVLATIRRSVPDEDPWTGKQLPDPGDSTPREIPGTVHAKAHPTSTNPKHALGTSKVPLHWAPMSAVVLLALAHEFGGKKYGITNWRDTDVVRSIYLDAMGRHYMALMDGQDTDEESGLPHEAHIMACCAIIIDARELGRLIDDRGTPGNVAEVLKRYAQPVSAEGPRGYPYDGAR